jgi:hypothetical protein
MSAAIITLAMLKSAGACADQVALCEATFGDSVVVTREAMSTAAEAGISIEWGARRLLRGPFLEAYNAVRDEACKAYNAARDEARKAYTAATAGAFKAYAAAAAKAGKAYHAAMAAPFADAFIAQCRAEVAA